MSKYVQTCPRLYDNHPIYIFNSDFCLMHSNIFEDTTSLWMSHSAKHQLLQLFCVTVKREREGG